MVLVAGGRLPRTSERLSAPAPACGAVVLFFPSSSAAGASGPPTSLAPLATPPPQDLPKALHKCTPNKDEERATGFSSAITVGSLLPARLPIMKVGGAGEERGAGAGAMAGAEFAGV